MSFQNHVYTTGTALRGFIAQWSQPRPLSSLFCDMCKRISARPSAVPTGQGVRPATACRAIAPFKFGDHGGAAIGEAEGKAGGDGEAEGKAGGDGNVDDAFAAVDALKSLGKHLGSKGKGEGQAQGKGKGEGIGEGETAGEEEGKEAGIKHASGE